MVLVCLTLFAFTTEDTHAELNLLPGLHSSKHLVALLMPEKERPTMHRHQNDNSIRTLTATFGNVIEVSTSDDVVKVGGRFRIHRGEVE